MTNDYLKVLVQIVKMKNTIEEDLISNKKHILYINRAILIENDVGIWLADI